MIQNMIAYHCGPALAGIKPANILTCKKVLIPDVIKQIDTLNADLNKKDIYFQVLCECDKRALVMGYRKKRLTEHLNGIEIGKFLREFGYAEEFSLDTYIEFLKSRIADSREFPHEIGAFLGYPLHDIYGFINHREEGCLFTGDWKVYKEEAQAKLTFARYRSCKEAILKRVQGGQTLAQLFCAV